MAALLEGRALPKVSKNSSAPCFLGDDLDEELKGTTVISEPNSPSEGLLVAFIEVDGAPLELMQYTAK